MDRSIASFGFVTAPPMGSFLHLAQMQANYRMKLTRLGHQFAQGMDNQAAACSLARARLGLQLMRGR